jgi:thioredoxin-related protein
MKRLVFFLLLFGLPLVAGNKKPDEYVPVHDFDVARDPAKDLQAAIGEALRTDRNILLDVGGHWCKWCMHLDKFFTDHPDVLALRDKNFVVVYVNFSDLNKNEKFLKQFPAPKGFPHLYVLNSDGKLIQSEDTGKLEDGKSGYDPDKIRAFLTEYGPGKLQQVVR